MRRVWEILGRWFTPFTAFLIVALVVLSLGGCTTNRALDAVQDAAAEDGTLAKRMADSLLGEVSGMDHRAVRMCMIAAVASELVQYRMTKEPEQAMMGYGQIAALEAVVDRFEHADSMWLNTEIAQITLTMTSIMVESAKDRIPKLLSNFAGGVNVLGLLDRAAIAAGQGTLLAAGIQDIKERVIALNNNTANPRESMYACRARLDLNQDRVQAMIGVGSP
ncbi:MAG: hypothetical protein IPK59_03980 [Rhodospirillaceae bacterium]|nr:hypothetical protein [Rhodospirillaceae bacterium]